MDFDEIVVKESPGLCRCCLSEGCYKDLGSEYSWMSETEIYADMLLECFDISISQHPTGPNGSNRLICEVCITRLRDACNFKKQVLESEKKFVDMVGRGEFRPKVLLYQTQMKSEINIDLEEDTGADDGEVEYLEEDVDYVDEDLLKNEDYGEPSVSEDITVSALTVKGKRGRPKKSSTKPERKAKVPKLEEKKKPVPKENQDARKREELVRLLTTLIKHSTILPFKWHANGYLCFYCGCPFDDSTKLKQHTKVEHENAKLKTVLRHTVARSKSIKLDVSDLSCKICNDSMISLQEFFTHLIKHDIVVNEEATHCCYPFKLTEQELSCLECGVSFRFFGTLLIHTHKHHGKTKPYLCEVCGQGFIAKGNVESHRKMCHPSACSFKCSECNESFPTQYRLRYHFDKIHLPGKLKCPKCPEILASKYLRKRHLAFVHDVKSSQFKCDQCPKMFSLNNKLVQHKLRVHLKEKNFACEICGFKVFSKDLLKRHMVKHDDSRPFECDFCKKTFQRKKTLEFHRRIHTNDKRYQCKECGRAFVQWTSLKLHTRVHHSGAADTWT